MSSERKKIFVLGAVSNYGTNLVTIVTGILSVPIGLHYFGIVRYGIWALITSVIFYLNISNLGLNTAASALTSKASTPYQQRIVLQRSFLFLIISSSTVLCVLLGITYLFPNWVVVLGKIPADLQNEAARAAIIIGILFLVNLPITIFSSGFIGFQKFYLERLYGSLTVVSGLFALILTVLIKGNLVTLALTRGIAILIISILCAFHFLITHSELRAAHQPDVQMDEEFFHKSIFLSGIRFFIIGIAALVVWNTDNLVISHFLGVKSVTPFAVTFKLFMVLFPVFTAISSTLFPMFGKAAGLMQWDWIQKTYQKALCVLPLIGGLVWLGGIAFAKQIIYFWAGPEAFGGMLVVFALGGYGYLLSMVNIHAFLLTGLNATKNMIFIGWAEAIANLGISIALVRIWGIGGVAFGTFIASFLTVFWMLPLDIYRQTEKKVKFIYRPALNHALLILAPSLMSSLLIQAYWPDEITKVILNTAVVTIYCLLSWRVIPAEIRSLAINTVMSLRHRLSPRIQEEMD